MKESANSVGGLKKKRRRIFSSQGGYNPPVGARPGRGLGRYLSDDDGASKGGGVQEPMCWIQFDLFRDMNTVA